VEVVAVGEGDVGRLGGLLADVYAAHTPLGARHVFADAATACAAVAGAAKHGPAFAAVADNEVVGFFVAPLPAALGPSSARLGIGHHVARPSASREGYRRLYEAASSELISAGVTYHSLPLLTDHADAAAAFFELEFGLDQIDGLLSVPSHLSASIPDGTRAANGDDVDRVLELVIELQQFHSRPPMFQPALLDVAATRRGIEHGVDDDRSLVVVVEEDGDLVAAAQVGPSSAYRDAVDIGMNVVTESYRGRGVGSRVLQHILVWASSRGYRYCSVGWTSSNPISDPFYRSRGFLPVRYRLHRRIAQQVLWANDRVDYRRFNRR